MCDFMVMKSIIYKITFASKFNSLVTKQLICNHNMRAQKHCFSDVEDLQLEFIKKYHIQFLIFSSRAKFPKWLKADDLAIKDPLTGEHFVVINSNIKR